MSSSLRAVLDGQPLPPDEAHTLWTRFSAYMDDNEGDFAGFAAALGFTEAKVGMVEGKPTLQLSSRGRSGAAPSERKKPKEPKAQRPKPAPNSPKPAPKSPKPKPKSPKPEPKSPKPHRKSGGRAAGTKKRATSKAGAKKPQRGRGGQSVDIGDAKPKRPRRK